MSVTRRRRRQLNPRQRQGVLLVALAALGLVGVLVLIASFVASVNRQVGSKIGVLELTRAVSAYATVTESDLREVSVPAKWAPSNALRDPSQVGQLVAGTALPAHTVLQQGMLIAPPTLRGNEREIAILVDSETGIADQITPGSRVDVIADYAGNDQGQHSSSQVVVSGVQVLGVGTTSPSSASSGGSSRGQTASAENGGAPVTLLLAPSQVLKVSYAESFAQKVRLSLLPPGQSGPGRRIAPYQPAHP